MMTKLTIAGGTRGVVLVLLGLLFTDKQDLLLQRVLLGTTGWFYPHCLLIAERSKTSWGGDGLTSHMGSVTLLTETPAASTTAASSLTASPWPNSASIVFASPGFQADFGD